MTTTPQTPTPPAGTRWREVAHPFLHGVWWRFTDRLQVKSDDSEHGWQNVHVLRDFGPEHITVIHDLMQRNTEPLPAPVVDRGTEAWKKARDFIGYAWQRGRDNPLNHVPLISNDEGTDALILALAPYHKELAQLAGEMVTKVTVLEGWWNVYSWRIGDVHPSAESARKFCEDGALHTAVRLAVVEDAS